MHIAICDDNINDLETLEKLIKEYYSSSKHYITRFTNIQTLYDHSNVYDVIILDIETKAANGYDVARRIKERNPNSLIIFLTFNKEYTISGYGIAFRYLLKPISREHLFIALDSVDREMCTNRFAFSYDGISHILHFENIYYIEVYNHNVVLHTENTEFTFRSTLKEVIARLPTKNFGIPHQSYIVNYAHIAAVTLKEVYLTNGVKVPISRRRLKEFERHLGIYLSR